MRPSTASLTARRDPVWLCAAAGLLLAALALCSLFVGKYPLSPEKLLAGDPLQLRVFWTLRFSRTLMGVLGASAWGRRALSIRRYSAIPWPPRM